MTARLLFLVFLLSAPIIIAAADPPYKATEHILLSSGIRGSNLKSTADGQVWEGDVGNTRLSPDIMDPKTSTAVFANVNPDVSVKTVPYITARVIHSRFSYIFPLSAGQKILRLYFYPYTYTSTSDARISFDKTKALADVTANHYTLLSNFSAYAAIEGGWRPQWVRKPAYVIKEYIINVREAEPLTVTFSPSSPGSYAFVNGVEVVSLPENFYMGPHDTDKKPLRFVNSPGTQFEIDETNTAFETMNRVAMGGGSIADVDDTGMFREWVKDDNYLISMLKGNPLNNNSISLAYTPQTPAYSAPAVLYKTARAMGRMAAQKPPMKLMWSFEVDSGYTYLLRLHFCEFIPSLFFQSGQRVFKIYIDNIEAETADIIYFTGGTGIPTFRDYVVLIPNPKAGFRSKYDLRLALAPDSNSQYLDAFVNGAEVFKLSTTDGYLAGVNPAIPNACFGDDCE